MKRMQSAGSFIELDPGWVAKNAPMLRGQPVAIYGRDSGVSSLDGSGADSQMQVTRRFAEACGAIIVKEGFEVIRGVFITARSTFNEILDMATAGKINIIIVDVRDRLGRGDAIAVLEFLAKEAGAQIVYATQPRDQDSYEGVALSATEALLSGLERLVIRRRTDRGRRDWVSEGRIFTGRFFPYGYRIHRVRAE